MLTYMIKVVYMLSFKQPETIFNLVWYKLKHARVNHPKEATGTFQLSDNFFFTFIFMFYYSALQNYPVNEKFWPTINSNFYQ